MASGNDVLRDLMGVVEDRNRSRPNGSYTTKLLEGGVEVIGSKVMEEAAEVVDAARQARERGSQSVVHEAADLVYHLLVLLAASNVTIGEVETELKRRFGTSGLEEKASRQ